MDKEIKFGGHWIICSDEKVNIICSNCGNEPNFFTVEEIQEYSLEEGRQWLG